MQFNLLKNKEKNLNSNSNLNKKTREKSLGRSMVEMLGVLAIIGVLSIAGISGYTIAMRRYQANEIISLLTKYASIKYITFENYMMNNQKNIRISAYYRYVCNKDSSWYTWNCPYYDISGSEFKNMGLGNLPKGVTRIMTTVIMAEAPDPRKDGVEVDVTFNNKELCKTVANLLSFYIAQDGSDGNHCEKENRIAKQFPID